MIEKEPSPYLHSRKKRWLDISVATGGLAFTSPVWPTISLINYLKGECTLCRLPRVGLNQNEFTMYKFETMYNGAEKSQIAQSQAMLGGYEREDDDPRVMPIYQKTHFRSIGANEIPQMINVLKGEMSIIGPRPYPKKDLENLKEMYPEEYYRWKAVVFFARPGFSVNPRIQRQLGDNDFPLKAKLDIDYVYNASLWKDLTIIADTINYIRQTTLRSININKPSISLKISAQLPKDRKIPTE